MRQTQPVNGAIRADQGSGMQVPDNGIVLDLGHLYRLFTSLTGRTTAVLIFEPEAGIEPAIYRLPGGCFAIKPLRLAQQG